MLMASFGALEKLFSKSSFWNSGEDQFGNGLASKTQLSFVGVRKEGKCFINKQILPNFHTHILAS